MMRKLLRNEIRLGKYHLSFYFAFSLHRSAMHFGGEMKGNDLLQSGERAIE